MPILLQRLLTLFLLLSHFNSKGQSASYSMQMDTEAKIDQLHKTGDSGFVAVIFKYNKKGNTETKDWKLCYMNSRLENVWTYEHTNDGFGNFIVSNPESGLVYWMKYHNDYDDGWHSPVPTQTKRLFVTRIKKNGEAENLRLTIEEPSPNYDILAACADKSKVYIISHRVPDYKHMTKEISEELFLNTLSHSEKKLNRKKINIDLKGGSVSFLGFNDGKMYFSQQRLGTGKMDIDIYVTDMDGQVQNEFTISPSINGYFKMHEYGRVFNHAYLKDNNSFYYAPVRVYNDNAFGEVKLNFKTNELHFVAFAVDDKDCITGNCTPLYISGFLCETYTIDGKRIKSVDIPFKQSFKDLPEYSKWAIQSGKSWLTEIDSRILRITTVGPNIYTIITIENGEIKDKYMAEKKFYNHIDQYHAGESTTLMNANLHAHPDFAPQSYLDYVATIKKGYFKSVHYSALNWGKKFVIVKFTEQKKDNLLEFMLFE